MVLRSEQLAAIESDFRKRRREGMLERVRAVLGRMPVADAEALRRIDEAIEDGKALGITRDDDVVRFAALAFLPRAALQDAALVSSLIRTLNRSERDAGARLDFIYQRLVADWIPLRPFG